MGSAARYDVRGISSQPGTVMVNQTATPAAGTYDVRFVVAGNNANDCYFSNSSISAGVN